jgi:serine-type D-Ala-D-Ala carboxypeptidase/endopeptidase (penicillin-binding protein 4)
MRNGVLWCAMLLFVATALAQEPAKEAPSAKLPASVTDIFSRAHIPADAFSVVVREAGGNGALVSINAAKSMNPASVIKLVTTYAGLELLGPAHTWKTEALAAGDIRGSVLLGDLVLRGSGDPKLTTDRFNTLLRQLRDRGLSSIRGDLVLDKSIFEAISHNPAEFDGEPMKAYNVGPDPLLLQFKAVRFFFAPTIDGSAVSIAPDVRLSQLEIVNRVKLTEGACGEWRNRIAYDVQTPESTQLKVAFTGNFPKSCGEQVWPIALLDHARFVGGAFAKVWAELGGSWSGAVKVLPTPPEAKLLAVTESPPLAETVRDINKFSNNVMARQLYLALSADGTAPASVARSTQRVREWLARKNIAAPELAIENGSGLSRGERIGAQTLAAMLDAAWKSSVMPEFISSMALAGVDGTMRRRARSDSVAGQAHVKGGTLNDVRAIAGYVLDQNGKRWIVVMMVNHPNAGLAQGAQDALLKWVVQGAPR